MEAARQHVKQEAADAGGLGLDYVAVCWGGDLIWGKDEWVPRMMRAPRWQVIRETEKRRFRLNGYRVLLTRGRAGNVMFVPSGSEDDPTRSPRKADAIAGVLQTAGCVEISERTCAAKTKPLPQFALCWQATHGPSLARPEWLGFAENGMAALGVGVQIPAIRSATW